MATPEPSARVAESGALPIDQAVDLGLECAPSAVGMCWSRRSKARSAASSRSAALADAATCTVATAMAALIDGGGLQATLAVWRLEDRE